MDRRAFLVGLSALVSGCASLPPPPSSTLSNGARVGLLLELDSSAVHEHVGATIFNNFSARRTLPWDLAAQAKTAFSSALSEAGFEVVDLATSGVKANAANALAIATDKGWRANPGQAETLDQLRAQFQLSAIIVVYGQRTLASVECGVGPCAERYVPTSGLFTRSVLVLTNYYAVPAFETKVFLLAPPVDLSAYDPIRKTSILKVKLLRDMREPKDFKNLSDEEFAPVADWIGTYLQQIATDSASALSSAKK